MYFTSNKLENWDRKQWEIANVKSPNPITMIDQLKKQGVTIKSYLLKCFQVSFWAPRRCALL
jgi:hypothetical protein